jgi:hypothetical protein
MAKNNVAAGTSTSGFFRGYYFKTAEELIFWIYSWTHGHKVFINTKSFVRTLKWNKSYTPDFVDEDGIYYDIRTDRETWRPFPKNRINAVTDAGFVLRVIGKNEIEPMKQEVLKQFGVKYAYQIYDRTRVKLEYTCHWCGKKFLSKTKRESKITYCSRQCVGKARQGKTPNNKALANWQRERRRLKEEQ